MPSAIAKQLARCRAQWGRVQERERDWGMLDSFLQLCPLPDDTNPAEVVDAQTASELNLPELFARLDRTLSTAGACVLYRALHLPVRPREAWTERRDRVRLLGADAGLRQRVQAALLEAGCRHGTALSALLWDELPAIPRRLWVFRALTAASITAFILALLTLQFGWWLLLIALFLADLRAHYGEQRRLDGRMGALRQLRRLIRAAEIASALDPPGPAVPADLHNLTRNRAMHKLVRRLDWLLPESNASAAWDLPGVVLEYLDIFLLHQVRTFYASLGEVRSCLPELRQIFLQLGELDACQSIANWRAGTGGWCEPELDDQGPVLAIAAARHPLLDNPVANSLTLSLPGVAVTGSNMSGKTTFLRTIAVNVLLAQTAATCLAASYHGQVAAIVTSMKNGDSLMEGKSYYLAEAERLLQIVRLSEGPRPVLALIDEPLAGTNSPERHAASRAILCYLAAHRGLVFASTHDVELVRALESSGLFAPFHFSDSAGERGLHFDYQLHPGLDYHANALAVLRYLGYPDAILNAASLAEAEPERWSTPDVRHKPDAINAGGEGGIRTHGTR